MKAHELKAQGRKAAKGVRTRQKAFTLVEVMMSVAILAIMAISINRFVVSTMKALQFSAEASAERAAMAGLVNMVQAQLLALPPTGPKRLVGIPHKFGKFSSDILEWGALPGLGVMTSAAEGEYRVSLELKPKEKTSSVLELGLRRRPVNGTEKDETWLPLMSPIVALEIRYFHPQLSAKVDRWNDATNLPSLVYLSIQRNADEFPYEAVLTVPGARIQR